MTDVVAGGFIEMVTARSHYVHTTVSQLRRSRALSAIGAALKLFGLRNATPREGHARQLARTSCRGEKGLTMPGRRFRVCKLES